MHAPDIDISRGVGSNACTWDGSYHCPYREFVNGHDSVEAAALAYTQRTPRNLSLPPIRIAEAFVVIV
jgi:hypothetical protein